ncbi:hypothetical protein TNCV_1701951 [Trichonephila clavipes]|nr:hypothetical protein TNCV_1701951 [Trichonephila clavipes]
MTNPRPRSQDDQSTGTVGFVSYGLVVRKLLGVSYEVVSEIHFWQKGIEAIAKVYQNTIVKILILNLFNGNDWNFQQDFAPAYRVKTTWW